MKMAYRAAPVLQGGRRYYVDTAQGTISKAIVETEKWIAQNRLDGEVWFIEVEGYFYL
jgi:hypothetical protein